MQHPGHAEVIAKLERIEDPAYLAWCRVQPCFACGVEPAGQAHHTIFKSRKGTVRDDWAVPCCYYDHQRCHGIVVVMNGRRLLPIPKGEQFVAAAAAREKYLAEKNAGTMIDWIPF